MATSQAAADKMTYYFGKGSTEFTAFLETLFGNCLFSHDLLWSLCAEIDDQRISNALTNSRNVAHAYL